MKTIKNLKTLLIFLSLVALLFVGCKNEDKTGNGEPSNENSKITLSHYAGSWYIDGTDTLVFKIKHDGSFEDASSGKTFPSSDITRNSETSYTLPDKSKLNFSSDTQGTFTVQGNEEHPPVNITKRGIIT